MHKSAARVSCEVTAAATVAHSVALPCYGSWLVVTCLSRRNAKPVSNCKSQRLGTDIRIPRGQGTGYSGRQRNSCKYSDRLTRALANIARMITASQVSD